MAVRTTPHHTTSLVVAQTHEAYVRNARLFLTRWGMPRYKRPSLLAEWLTLLPKRAVLLDLGCGGGQDSRYLKALGHRVVGPDRTMALLRFGKKRSLFVPRILATCALSPPGCQLGRHLGCDVTDAFANGGSCAVADQTPSPCGIRRSAGCDCDLWSQKPDS